MAIRITITGPESTGKSTLAVGLATHYNAELIKEYARTYLTPGKPYTLADVVKIADQQHRTILQAKGSLQIVDTDGLTTYLWAKDKFAVDRKDIFDQWQSHYPQHYLLCYPDIPWEADPLREDAKRLPHLFALYHTYIKRSGVNYTIIKGEGTERLRMAITAIQEVLT